MLPTGNNQRLAAYLSGSCLSTTTISLEIFFALILSMKNDCINAVSALKVLGNGLLHLPPRGFFEICGILQKVCSLHQMTE